MTPRAAFGGIQVEKKPAGDAKKGAARIVDGLERRPSGFGRLPADK